MVRALYPGSFDPVHNGHVDIATRAARLFDELVVGVYDTPPSKRLMFTTEERVELFKRSIPHLSNVRVVPFVGLAPMVARSVDAKFIIRGLRAGEDFETEFEMALMWRNIDSDIDVVCLMTALENQFVHSSRIKEVAQLGGRIENLIPAPVFEALTAKMGAKADAQD